MNKLISYLQTFRPISGQEEQIIDAFFEQREYKEGDFVFRGLAVCHLLLFVVEGVLRITATNNNGIEQTYYFIGEDQFCTILASFNNDTLTEDGIQCCTPATIMVIAKSRLQELYRELPFMEDIIGKANQQRLLEKIRLKNAYAGQDAASRYQLFLREQPEIATRAPLSHIASYLDITPQSLSRIRRNFKSAL